MLYNVSQLLMDPTGSTRRFELNERLGEEAEGPFAAMASGTVRLLRTHQGLLLMATLEVESDTECARCLAGVARVATLDLEEECYPTVDPSTGRRMYPSDVDEGALHIDMNQMLDLSDVLRQYLLTSEPLRALCRQDCRGLCRSVAPISTMKSAGVVNRPWIRDGGHWRTCFPRITVNAGQMLGAPTSPFTLE